MDRPRGEYKHTNVESGGETRWNDCPSKGSMLAEEVDGGRGRRSRGGGASTPSHRPFISSEFVANKQTLWACSFVLDVRGVAHIQVGGEG